MNAFYYTVLFWGYFLVANGIPTDSILFFDDISISCETFTKLLTNFSTKLLIPQQKYK